MEMEHLGILIKNNVFKLEQVIAVVKEHILTQNHKHVYQIVIQHQVVVEMVQHMMRLQILVYQLLIIVEMEHILMHHHNFVYPINQIHLVIYIVVKELFLMFLYNYAFKVH